VKKILILGGAGFIGLNIAKFLLNGRDYDVHIVDNLFRGKLDLDLQDFIKNSRVKFLNLDLTQFESFNLLNDKYDYVYLLASMVGVEYVEKMPHEIIRVNTQIILNTAEWLRSGSVDKILFTSTSECYAGAIDQFNYIVPTPEDVPLVVSDIAHPRFTYAVTKMLGESTFLNYSKALGFKATIVRYHNVYGPRMGFKHVIPQLVYRMVNGENPLKVFGAHQTRSFNFIDDAVRGTVAAMELPAADQQIFHIGDSRFEITIMELANYIGEVIGYKGRYEAGEIHSGSVNRRCPDTSKAQRILDYNPKVNWKDGVKEAVLWYRDFYSSSAEKFE